MAVSIVVYEDNSRLRDSIANLITFSDGLLLLGAFPDALQIETQTRELQPEVILMDIDMPGMSGIEAVQRVRCFNPDVQIIMITIFDDNQHVLDSIIAGANGYLLKKEISDQLQQAIGQVMNNEAPMSPAIAKMVIDHLRQKPERQIPDYELSAREKEILSSLSKGNSYKLIADQYEISINTVRTHIKKIYEKLQVHSQTEAISKALREKIV